MFGWKGRGIWENKRTQNRRNWATVQEQIDAVSLCEEIGTMEDLDRLMRARFVSGSGNTFHFNAEVNGTRINTPPREHLYLLLQDIPAFSRAITSLAGENEIQDRLTNPSM
jgi:hypothetical protein